jgi:hypothetical protein
MANILIKLLASACALVFVLALPADAKQSRKQRQQVTPRTTTGMATAGYRGTNLFPPGPVTYGNEILGNDPDPFIRSQIQRDLGAHFGGSD